MKLNLDRGTIERGRAIAAAVATDIGTFIDRYSTVSVERSVARLKATGGVDGLLLNEIATLSTLMT